MKKYLLVTVILLIGAVLFWFQIPNETSPQQAPPPDPVASEPAAKDPPTPTQKTRRGQAPRASSRKAPQAQEDPAETAEPEAKALADIEGIVYGPDGYPLEGAWVKLSRPLPGEPDPDVVYSDAAGRFTFPRISRMFSLKVGRDGYATANAFVFREEKLVEVQLAKSQLFKGRVVDATTQKPLPRFEVRHLERYKHTSHSFEDRNGAFEMAGLLSGEARFWIHAPGYVPTRFDTTIPSTEIKQPQVFPLVRVTDHVAGQTLDESGKILADVTVSLVLYEGERLPFSWDDYPSNLEAFPDGMLGIFETRTDASGRFRFDLPHAEMVFDLAFSGNVTKKVLLDANQLDYHHLKVIIPAGGALFGTVNRELYPAAKGVKITFKTARMKLAEKPLGEDEYHVDNLPEGRYSVALMGSTAGGGFEVLEIVQLDLGPSEERRLDFGFARNFPVEGSVSVGGRSKRGGTLFLVQGSQWVQTSLSPTGRFRFEEVAEGDYMLVLPWVDQPQSLGQMHMLASYPNRLSLTVDGPIDAHFDFERYGTLKGRFRKPQGKDQVVVAGETDGGAPWSLTMPCDEFGGFQFAQLPPGTYDLSWFASNNTALKVLVRQGVVMTSEDLDLGLLAGEAATLEVALESPSAYTECHVQVKDLEGNVLVRRFARSFPAEMRLFPLPAGEVVVSLEPGEQGVFSATPTAQQVTLEDEHTTQARFQVEPGVYMTLTSEVRMAQVKLIHESGETIVFQELPEDQWTAQHGPVFYDRVGRIANIPRGNYTLVVFDPNERRFSRSLELRGGRKYRERVTFF